MMTPRERVTASLSHEEPDRVPTALWGGPYGLVDELYLALLEHLNLGDPVPPFRSGHNISYMDDRVLDRLGTDTRYVWPGASPSSPDPHTMLDGFGQPWKKALPYYYPDSGILEGASLEDIDRLANWPDPKDPRWTAGVRERARYLKEETDCFVIARMVTSHGVFQTASNLRGMVQLLLDLVIDEAFVRAIVARVTDAIDGLLRSYLGAGGGFFDMVELPGDDYATSDNLIMAPETFRTFFKPSIRRLVETIKSYRSDLKVMFHSDGAIEPLIPDLIEIGVDAIHPLEPLPAMDLAAIKEAYGDQIAFVGGIDIVGAMPGSREGVIEEARQRMRQLAPGGGYVLAPANHLQADVPAENVVALFEAAWEFGAYPIQG